ncbi:MAG: PP2C family protein-serine/threonine phosphatase [Bacteroidia bacterium]
MEPKSSLKSIKSIRRLIRLGNALGALVAALGILVLLGWYFDIDVFKRPVQKMVAMNPVTALCFILSSLSFFMLTYSGEATREKRAGYALASIVLITGLVKIGSLVAGVDLYIDSWLFSGKLEHDIIGKVSNRMAPNTALGFVFTGAALLLLNTPIRKKRMPSHYFVVLVGLLGMLSVLGYLYQVKVFYGFLEYIPMAIHTGIGFLMIALAILFVHPDKGIMFEITRTQVGAITARRLIPAAIGIPALLGFIGLQLEWNRIVSQGLGITFIVLGNMMIFFVLIWINIRELNRKDDLRRAAKERLEQQNKDILDSITYAKRLQDAILPPISLIKKHLPESFVLYKPKEIVAGDFYWMEKVADMTLITAADCTGHGVPGALVSVVCSNALNRTVKEFQITEPGKILDKVRELVLETFEKSENNVQDGMDISLASLSPSGGGMQVQWSGAYNSLLYIKDGEMREVAADKQPIGKHDKAKPFNTHNLKLQKGDTLYLLTDGYADQFGGPKGKKFKYKQMQEFLLANATKSLEEQKNILEKTLSEWKGNFEQVDDILIIGLRV